MGDAALHSKPLCSSLASPIFSRAIPQTQYSPLQMYLSRSPHLIRIQAWTSTLAKPFLEILNTTSTSILQVITPTDLIIWVHCLATAAQEVQAKKDDDQDEWAINGL